jgi:hypothetical protein
VTTPPDELVVAWRQAAGDLGVEVSAPYSTHGHHFVALVEGFGSPRGTVIDWLGSGNTTAALAGDGYYVSCINPEAYQVYERAVFAATLDDWGWRGEVADRPRWLTGQPWTA